MTTPWHTNILLPVRSNQDWIGRACSMHGTEEKTIKYFGRKTKRPHGIPSLIIGDNIKMHLEEI
jgi:hypothetical protein